MHVPLRIAVVAGARPNFPKVAPILGALHALPDVDGFLVHTGQHYDPELSGSFLEDLGIPTPRWSLGAGSGRHGEQTARILIEFERHCLGDRPDCIVVVGDVNSTLACTLVGAKLQVATAHVEAGLRSGDRTMPEEINRLATDAIADRLYTYCDEADDNLAREGIPTSRRVQPGNVMIDTLLRLRSHATPPAWLPELGLEPGGFGVVTLHRPALVDDPARLVAMVEALADASGTVPLVWPLHPRSLGRLRDANVLAESGGKAVARYRGSALWFVPAMRYLEFLWLLDRARIAVTDSGGVQEESTVLGVPCLTVRANTERAVTITHGTNRLVGLEPDDVKRALLEAIASPRPLSWPIPAGWDGHAAGRLVADLVPWLMSRVA